MSRRKGQNVVKAIQALSTPAPVPEPGCLRLKFVCAYGFFAWLIARFGFSWGGFSHVAPMLPDGSFIDARDDWIYAGGEEIRPGVRPRPRDYERWKRWAVVVIPCTAEQEKRALQFLHDAIGDPYDSEAITGFAVGLKEHQHGHYICSALGHAFMRQGGVCRRPAVPDYEISPDALYLLATSLGEVKSSYGLKGHPS